ncbi:[FeFe] hydrogenase, group A [Ethanoligenens harbinense]|uniref:Hydrogenase, Fe-only n=1 Tax=Ethanoligenens harbinense (strain DSM 18485 / JCM 12961 / CGMCC 1.5033 / YUAN-3) TaxID=663278 RepID=E6U737_ETHHY|nr:[FeFe] hydrogenase, group A [Ethanoligenens harbinense]ADU28107.1 hydrogenase, Fe-only [Ethanoligenens harbinense YUAN-3]AVQ97116.1 ferredoxin [Ethanoligenens harbinense YUAN-3]AYF39778.1 ferredoxin [Ethanoligenens harbinense]AYF42610.1 ferredoxin [Ethanoligenens harbinense]QCN93359.1 4Fe-4S dicluster domain-containing protein [Ethanoligenens harbinense]
MKDSIVIDGRRVELDGEKNLLEVVRKAGIDLPTFCYYSCMSVYGACRMCTVEDSRGRTMAACSTPPKPGMEIRTNTERLRKYRRMILELLLSNHNRDCTTCEKNGSCKLQELALRFGVRKVRFRQEVRDLPLDTSSPAILRDPQKCILCGDCVRMCAEVQGVGALAFAYRGSDMEVTTAFHRSLGDVGCVGCGQCAGVCPTGAITVRDDTARAWKALQDPQTRVVAQIAPAVRVAIGEEFGMEPGEVTLGKLVAAMRMLGFDEVYDTGLGADLTVTEEGNELLDRLQNGGRFPMFTSCCPGWVTYARNRHPELAENISTCRSPMGMFGAVLRDYFSGKDTAEGKKTFSVAVMPCTGKKLEAGWDEMVTEIGKDIDVVLTTQEIAQMIREGGIDFAALESEGPDMPFGLTSGAGVIFGVTGGVTEAVLRNLAADSGHDTLQQVAFTGVRGMEGVKEASAAVDGRELRVAVVHGLRNAEQLIQDMQAGRRQYDFVEVMACPGGCIGGGGQPGPQAAETRAARAKGLYQADSETQIRRSQENPVLSKVYGDVLGENHHRLHRGRH